MPIPVLVEGKGRAGQIIVYQHDPDGIYYVAPDLVSFLRLSNELLREEAEEYIVRFSGV
jgi:cell wall assembly regulator SMI1